MNILLAETVQATGTNTVSVFCYIFLTAVVGGAVGLLYFAIRELINSKIGGLDTKINHLKDADDRIEQKLSKIYGWATGMNGRVIRIETTLKISPFSGASPIQLTDIGQEILKNSGIKEACEQFEDKLLAEIKKENPTSAYDVQEATRSVFQTFEFDTIVVDKLKDFVFKSGKWQLSDVREVGAIYFRDIALPLFGFKVEDLDTKPTQPPK